MYLSILKEAFIIWGVVFGIMYIYIYIYIYLSFNIKRGFHHLGDSCSILNKINIISASGLWGINVSAIRKIEGSLVKLKGN